MVVVIIGIEYYYVDRNFLKHGKLDPSIEVLRFMSMMQASKCTSSICGLLFFTIIAAFYSMGIVYMISLPYLYTGSTAHITSFQFGRASSNGAIFLSNVMCTGSEPNLLECPHTVFVGTHCVHNRDVGATCERKYQISGARYS